MLKKVRYNGGKKSHYECSNPSKLIKGLEYDVVSIRNRCLQTDYTLNGINGEFDSTWFDDVISNNHIYMAIANEIPVIGEKLSCYRVEFYERKPKLVGDVINVIKDLEYLGNNVYRVDTNNNRYIVNVG